ncbi:MAG: hypothetical protein H6550_16310 [Chitinophagales bacterium]|nr:hypothetical protein [Chitinophagales bacterium]
MNNEHGINVNDVIIGDIITADIHGTILTGAVTKIGVHKGKQCFDILLPDNTERFVYAYQITSIN